jgi:16S rRNA (guanine966-N2)-methyltransferase
VRVVGGAFRGRRLAAPRGAATRPTADRVREALFSILGERVEGARVLDLYAGSGALAIEALSRGAAWADLVDRGAAAVAAARANLEAVGVRDVRHPPGDGGGGPPAPTARVHRSDALRFLRGAAGGPRQYDLVFLDPPYALAARLGPELGPALAPVLAPGATVVGESDRRAPLDLDLPLTDERRYGDTLIRLHGP